MVGGKYGCQICGADSLLEIEGFSALSRVTSDCLPFRQGGRLCCCRGCGALQKPPDEQWLTDISEIYDHYSIYHQSGGVEQSVFDSVTGEPKRRSVVLAERLAGTLDVKSSGRVLDFGCGNGAMLAAISATLPGWSLFGTDLDDRNLESLQRIPGFRRLYTGPLGDLDGDFDLVTLSHSLEHVPAPHDVLSTVREKLTEGGHLFVQVPDAARNPFDLAVADHLCHFTVDTLSRLVKRSGFGIRKVETNWIKKEISLLAFPAEGPLTDEEIGEPLGAVGRARDGVTWLHAVVQEARRTAAAGRFGIFGSSIGATWLFAHLAGEVEFFIDEDPGRSGRRHLERPIWRPLEAPPHSSVYLALPPAMAHAVRDRLRALPLVFHLPPMFSGIA